MQKRQILINAAMSVFQIVTLSTVLFVLYKFLLQTIGVELLGVWSLVLATTSVTQIANSGISGSIVKFVAKYNAQGKHKAVSEVIQTASLSTGIFFGFVLIISYPSVKWILGLVVDKDLLSHAINVLPHALLSLWLLIITAIFQAGLDGLQRTDIRTIILMGGGIINLLLCYLLAPVYGILGVAYARVIQNALILLCSWLLLKKNLRSLPYVPYKININLFKEIIGYAVNFQIITIANMLYDPITKLLLSKFGDISMVAYYEMAAKMVQQFRAIIVSANQVLVPVFADLHETSPEKIRSIYLNSFELLFYLSLPIFSLLIVLIPFICNLWIGYYEPFFILCGILLAIGWFFNTLNAPAYFVSIGTGKLRWNVIAHIAIALLNISLGSLFGTLFDGIGVVVAWVIALIGGSCIINLSYQIENKISFRDLLSKSNGILLSFCLIAIILITSIHSKQSRSIEMLTPFLFMAIIFVPFWIHPMRKRLFGWLSEVLLYKG